MKISVVIPAFNEENTIEELIERCFRTIRRNRLDGEVVFVDDGSTDKTGDIADRLKKRFGNLIVIHNKKRMGKSYSLDIGFEEASGETIVFMDADLQQIPEEIPLLLEKIKDGYDIVNGWRYARHDPFSKLFFSKIFNKLAIFLFNVKIHDLNCPFKAFRKEILKKIILRPGYFRYLLVIAKEKGFKVTEVKVTHYKRRYGKSKFGSWRLIEGGLDLVSLKLKSVFSERPMLLFGIVGLILLGIGIVGGIYLAYLKFLLKQAISQHIPLLFFTTISLISGIQIFVFGFLAELIKDLEYKVEKRKR